MPHLEISDLITATDPRSGARLPVRRGGVVRRLREAGDRRAARIVAALPADRHDVLDPLAVDRLMIGVRTELQRLSEELLRPLVVTAACAGASYAGVCPRSWWAWWRAPRCCVSSRSCTATGTPFREIVRGLDPDTDSPEETS
ncbi:hypothetical protein ACFY04_31125 [Streptomyces sp. NPDC001549]|uniref:hypothetical protein n=1 Tax=Streptomyces sp. NPDC001549 TaxID=3364586 RepID=UPI0036B7298F